MKFFSHLVVIYLTSSFALSVLAGDPSVPNPRPLSLSPAESVAFYNGLYSSPQSPARKNSGEMLQRWLDESVSTLMQTQSYNQESSQIAKAVLQMTVDYLKEGKSCSADQKIRLYRGVGSKGLVEKNGTKLATWSTWNYAFVMNGQPIPAGQDEDHKQDPLSDLTYKSIEKEAYGAKMDLDWSNITYDHSGNGSTASILLSTSLEWTVSGHFASSALLVLDVCPERAMALYYPSDSTATFSESEIYLPLFALPEEITAIIPAVNGRVTVLAPEFQKQNELTKSLRRAFYSQDHLFDVQFLTLVAPRVSETDSGVPAQDAYIRNYKYEPIYNLIARRYVAPLSLEDWRSQIVTEAKKMNASKETCEYAYVRYTRSEFFSQGEKPKKSFKFPIGKLVDAQYTEQESLLVDKWFQEFNSQFSGDNFPDKEYERQLDGIAKYSEYSTIREAIQVYKSKSWIDFPKKCSGN